MCLQVLEHPMHALRVVAFRALLYLAGVRLIDATKVRTVLQCSRCRQRWTIPYAERYPKGFWRCPAGCNADGLR